MCGGPHNGGRDFNYFSPVPYGVGATRPGARQHDAHGIYYFVLALITAELPLFWTVSPRPTAALVCLVNVPSWFILCVVDFVNNRIFWAPSSATTSAEDGGRLFPDSKDDFVQVTKEKYTMIATATVKGVLQAKSSRITE